MATVNLGKVSHNPRGTYSNVNTYEELDNVLYNSKTYIANQDVAAGIGNEPDVLTGSWDLAADGADVVNSLLLNAQDGTAAAPSTIPLHNRVSKLGLVRTATQGRSAQIFVMGDGSLKGSGDAVVSGSSVRRFLPNNIAANENNVTFVKAIRGQGDTYAIDDQGKAWSFGTNNLGQLGHGDTINTNIATKIQFFNETGVTVTDIFTSNGVGSDSFRSVYFIVNSTQIGVNVDVIGNGLLYACGYGLDGNLGNGANVNSSTPVRCGTLIDIDRVTISGESETCVFAIDTSNNLFVWGHNLYSQLGDSSLGTGVINIPTAHPTHPSNVMKVASITDGTGGYTMMIKTDNTLWGSGSNSNGQLGIGGTTALQTNFVNVTANFSGETFVDVQISGGATGTTLVITNNGLQNNLWLFGTNSSGQLGNGSTTNTGTGFPSVNIFFIGNSNLESAFICGQDNDASVYCKTTTGIMYAVGANLQGQLSNGGNVNTSSFSAMKGVNGTIIDYAVYNNAQNGNCGICLLYSDGRAAYSGDNGSGQSGTRSNSVADQLVLSDIFFF
jgi:alpha-tubulin suppressor-like RCC1 family protein